MGNSRENNEVRRKEFQVHLSLFIKHNILTVFNLSEKTAIKRKADFFKGVYFHKGNYLGLGREGVSKAGY